ncbi:MAG: hypothetical protein V8R80_07145, partial [Eubacterium sp.]
VSISMRMDLILHHPDSFCEPIAKDMEEIGIDIWQGVIPSNDICKIAGELKRRYGIVWRNDLIWIAKIHRWKRFRQK